MSRLTERVIAGLLILFVLNMAYQILRVALNHYQYETVYDYTVSRSIPVEGIAVRDELVIEDKRVGIGNYLFEDGSRVAMDETVAEFYESDLSDASLRRSRELMQEIKMLEEAQDKNVNNFSITGILNRDIKEQLGYLTQLSGARRFSQVSAIRASLTSLINKKQIATGMETGYQSRIRSLVTEYDGLQRSEAASAIAVVKAPVTGYFCKTVDGYEDSINTKKIEDYRTSDFLSLIDGVPEQSLASGNIGKIVTSQNWLFAAAAPVQSLEVVRPGQSVFIKFESVNQKIPATVYEIMQEKDGERAVILLSLNQVSGALLGLRGSKAVISFDQFTGLRINTENIRFQGEKRGVYVAQKNTVRFKLIDQIYEEQGFVLSRLVEVDSMDDEHVALFDEIIKGNDLYDGKVIQ